MDHDALQIRSCRLDQVGRGVEGLAGDAREKRAVVGTPAEPLADLMGDRTAEAGMIEDRW